jgi:3-oxoacyl-[acyl-carrier protein] reductase
LCTQEATPHIPEGGRVILFSSSLTAQSVITPNYLLYVSTKGAIEQMGRVLAKDLGRRGITVNIISPGPTATEGFYGGKTDQIVNTIKGYHPANRIAEPDEIARAVLFIAGPDASWVNGQNLRVNGGMTVG